MSMNAGMGVGSGRGTCAMCGKPIAKGDKQIEVWGYRDSCRIHADLTKCEREEVDESQQLGFDELLKDVDEQIEFLKTIKKGKKK